MNYLLSEDDGRLLQTDMLAPEITTVQIKKKKHLIVEKHYICVKMFPPEAECFLQKDVIRWHLTLYSSEVIMIAPLKDDLTYV